MSTQDNPSSSSGVQQSLNIYSDRLIIEKLENGGHRRVVSELPEHDPDNNISVRPMKSETLKPKVEYPRERDHLTIHKHRETRTYRNSSGYGSQYKVFDIEIDREQHPGEAKRIERVVELLREYESLKATIGEFESYDELVSNAELVRRFEAIYNNVKGVWENDSLKSFALTGTARDFEINQYSQGFYVIYSPYHSTVTQILDEELKTRDLGFNSVAWGGFIVEPEDFSEVYEIVKPAYHTPDSEHALDMNKMR